MDEEILQSRLSRISTMWDILMHSRRPSPSAADQRWAVLLQRYQGAIYRYLLGAVRDADAADDLFQEFALRCLQGAFRGADPHRGRFRDYLKTALFHLIVDYQKKQQKRPLPLNLEVAEPQAPPETPPESERRFLDSWREDILFRAWEELAQAERSGGQPYYSVLKFRAENPGAASDTMAARLSEQLSPERPFTETGIRKTLQRARTRFAEILIAEVANAMENPTNDELEQELNDLGLLPYCRSTLHRSLDHS
jgi:RNA polymerase sigma factor (sigma-70 family)